MKKLTTVLANSAWEIVFAVLVVAGLAGLFSLPIPPQPVVHAQGDFSGEVWSCSLAAVDNNLTKCVVAPGSRDLSSLSQEKLFITDIVAQSTTATAGQFMLRYGTGTNCATGTTSLLPSSVTAVAYQYPGNAAAPLVMSFRTPLVVPPGAGSAGARHPDLCVLAVATNTGTIQISGRIGFNP